MQHHQTQFQYQPGPQASPAQWVLVGVGWRFLALVIDALIIGVIASIVGTLFFFPFWGVWMSNAGQIAYHADSMSGWGGTTGLIGLAYYIIMEATMGATPGKMALGMRVVKVSGAPIGWTESLIRNLLRIIDALFAYLVGAIFIWTSPLRQRLGDRVAGTVVIRRLY